MLCENISTKQEYSAIVGTGKRCYFIVSGYLSYLPHMMHVDIALAAPRAGRCLARTDAFLVACSKGVEVKRCGGNLSVRPNQYLSTGRQIRHPKAVVVRHILRRGLEAEPVDAATDILSE